MKNKEKELGKVVAGVKLYTIPEVAQAVGVTPQTIRNYIKKGRIKSNRIGRNLFITEKDLRDFAKGAK